MKNARILFKKDGACRYISHLDLNRVMLRAVVKSKIPLWHTEGFNPHPFVTFALPLSLGFRSECETMDFKLVDEDFQLDCIPSLLNACLPEGIRVLRAYEQVKKPALISFAEYEIILSDLGNGDEALDTQRIENAVKALFARDEIIVDKKSKSGIKQVDIKPAVKALEITAADETSGEVIVKILLPAGNNENVNPSLYVKALEKFEGIAAYADITRKAILCEDMSAFE